MLGMPYALNDTLITYTKKEKKNYMDDMMLTNLSSKES
jgi:hypothetical protein